VSSDSARASFCVELRPAKQSRLRTTAGRLPCLPRCRKPSPSSGYGLLVTSCRLLATSMISPSRCPYQRGRSHLQRSLRGCGEMSADRAIYLDSSAIVKLAVTERESAALRRYLRGRTPLVVSALARTEVARAMLPLGLAAVQRGHDVLGRLELIRVSDRILLDAGSLLPADLRSLDAIHLATMRQLGASLRRLLTYDSRMAAAATELGIATIAPA